MSTPAVWKLLHRENGGKTTFKDYKLATSHMENLIKTNMANKDQVYVVEEWVDQKCKPLSGVHSSRKVLSNLLDQVGLEC